MSDAERDRVDLLAALEDALRDAAVASFRRRKVACTKTPCTNYVKGEDGKAVHWCAVDKSEA